MTKFVCCVIGLAIIEHFKPEISADARIFAIAILMCGYIACKD